VAPLSLFGGRDADDRDALPGEKIDLDVDDPRT